MNTRFIYILLLVAATLTTACSVERNNPLSKAYHNTTAHYNGYFLANEKMAAIEKSLQEQMVYDYNLMLPVYPAIDSNTYKAFESDLEDVVKKASFPIQYHKNSKWIDDSYLLVGKARYYQLNFTEAAQTFKYINTNSTDRHTRHEALVWLMRCFMQEKEWDNAWAVSDVLRKERLNKDNARELYLARAQYHLHQGDTAALMENLALSVPNFEERDDQSRVRFSLGRLYQFTSQDKEAFKQYNRILKRNPPYDLAFFSRLYLGQVTELSNTHDKDRIAGYYRKMLKDSKNTEYRDKIYYEMALFELRQQNYDKAMDLLQQSLKENGTLQNQKAYSYQLAGEIYFENLGKFTLAQAYYDSAVQVLPQQAPGYAQVVERKDVLTDFVTQYNTIQTQDSLQRLAKLSDSERMAYLHLVVQQEEEQRLQELARQQERQQNDDMRASSPVNSNRNNTAFASNTTTASGVWYYDNPAAMATARSEFVRRWGNRPLQDNWRLQNRGNNEEPAPAIAQATATEAPAEDTEARQEAQVQTYLKNIPLTTLAMQQSEKLIEDALFNLGKIYSQKLNDSKQAADTYAQLLKRYPNSEHAPEVNYSLYLIYEKLDDAQKQTYYTQLKQKYPNTIYAKLVDDPAYMSQNAEENVKAHQLYDSAYGLYEQRKYEQASALLKQLQSHYPHNDISDKAAFLGVMITARTEKPQALREQLNRFKSGYPRSPLIDKANQLLATYSDLEQKNLLRKDAPSAAAATDQEAQLSQAKANLDMAATAVASTENRAVPQPKQQQEKKPEAASPAVTISETPKAVTTPETVNPVEVKQEAPAKPATPPTAAKEDAKQQEVATQQAEARQAAQVEQQTNAAITQAKPEDLVVTDSELAPRDASADSLQYSTDQDSIYYYVIAYPSNSPAFKDMREKYEKYNNTYYKNQNLTVEAIRYERDKVILVTRAFNNFKIAQDYNIKQKGPLAPVGRIRGVDFTTFVISSANYKIFLRKQDLKDYLNFFRTNY
ncbi:hypothetical protein C1N53_18745 [Pontibacter sp. SGAir0037]|nr:hypothetical protein C1N53_18745 [Pontibacter sp. SGAir0037]